MLKIFYFCFKWYSYRTLLICIQLFKVKAIKIKQITFCLLKQSRKCWHWGATGVGQIWKREKQNERTRKTDASETLALKSVAISFGCGLQQTSRYDWLISFSIDARWDSFWSTLMYWVQVLRIEYLKLASYRPSKVRVSLCVESEILVRCLLTYGWYKSWLKF